MSITLNKDGAKYAKNLISRGKVDRESSWEFSAEDGNRLLGESGEDFEHFGKFHLGIRTDEPEGTKARYAYPFGKGAKVYRSGVIAAQARAAQQGDSAIEEVAHELLEMIDKREDSAVKVSRSDFYGDWTEFTTSPMRRTHDGFLVGRATVTNIGVFPYPQADGSVRMELRHPDEVFHPDSIASLEGKPLTNDHPAQGVTPHTSQALTVGAVSAPGHDAYHVTAGIAVHNADAVRDVLAGKRALSCGYDCDLVEKSGVFQGVPYTHVQRNIRYNHVAIVDAGRAGDAARLRMDSVQLHTTKKETPMKKVHLDHVGVEVEVDPMVAVELEKLKADTAAHKAVAEKATADLDAATGRADAAESRTAALEKSLEEANDASRFDAAVAARVELLAAAEKFGATVDASMSPRAIQEAVCLKADPEIKLDGKSDEYVAGVFAFSVKSLSAPRKDAAPGPGEGSSAHSDGLVGSAALETFLNTLRADAKARLLNPTKED